MDEKKEGKKNRVGSIAAMRPRDAAKCPELVNPSKVFSLDDPDLEVFNSLPDWVKEKIQSNLEYAGSPLEALLGAKKQKEPKREQEEPAFDPDDQGEEEDAPY